MISYKVYLKVTGVQPRREGDFAPIRTVQIAQFQLSMLCASVLCGSGRIGRLALRIDGERTVFTGGLPTTELVSAIAKMTDAEETEAEAEFSTAWDYAGADALSEELDDMVLGEDVPWERIRFEMLVTDDDLPEGDPERVKRWCYGLFDGKIRCGRQREQDSVSA